MAWSWDIGGESAAAWVQAVGSVAAIVAAIVIDRGEARRNRRDRDAATDNLVSQRISTISRAETWLQIAADEVVAGRASIARCYLAPATLRGLSASERALDYYLTQPSEISAPALWAISEAADRLGRALRDGGGLVHGVNAADPAVEARLRDAARDLETIRRNYREDISDLI